MSAVARPEPVDAETYYRVTGYGSSVGAVLNAARVAELQERGYTVTPWWVPEPVSVD